MLCFFGFAFSRCANTMLGHRFASAGGFDPFWSEDLYSIASLVVFLACAILARKLAPLYSKAAPLRIAIGLSVIAAAFDFLAASTNLAPQLVFLLSILTAGASGALFILLWAEFHSCLDPLRIVFYVSGAFLFGTVSAWLLQDISNARRLLVLIACPLASAWCLRKSFSLVKPIDLPRSLWGRFAFPWKLVVVLSIYEFVYGMRESSPSFVWETYLIGAIGMALAVFSFACLFARKSDLTLLYRTPFALMFCGLAMAPITASLSGFASDLLVSAGYALMFLLITLLMCDLSRQHGVSVLVLCGVQELTAVFRLVGHQASSAVSNGTLLAPANDAMVVGALTLAIVVASVVLLSDRNPSQTWGASFFGVNAMKKMDDDALWLTQRCNELSDAYGLSPREREVFLLLARGKSTSQIERELVIANGTVKSHTRRIYQKLGIHTKRELVDAIGTGHESNQRA
ncbi:MAG: LuxR C-terminal-related transcriptional regulator [Slackia sp.]|nr:LuxR C-terminal-related transcriptional regulator [Slackia sp.]